MNVNFEITLLKQENERLKAQIDATKAALDALTALVMERKRGNNTREAKDSG